MGQQIDWTQIKNAPPFLQERDSLVFEAPFNIPDGVTTIFQFDNLPKFVTYNGLIQFSGIGYAVLGGGPPFQIQLLDPFGNIITPLIGDIIRAEIR